jgi:hypothetical protein
MGLCCRGCAWGMALSGLALYPLGRSTGASHQDRHRQACKIRSGWAASRSGGGWRAGGGTGGELRACRVLDRAPAAGRVCVMRGVTPVLAGCMDGGMMGLNETLLCVYLFICAVRIPGSPSCLLAHSQWWQFHLRGAAARSIGITSDP